MNKHQKALNWIAERSPKIWAKQIRDRFTWAFRELDRIEAKLDNPLAPFRPVPAMAHFGCPHCNMFQCEKQEDSCLYQQAVKKFKIAWQGDYPCADIEFDGVTLCSAGDGLHVRVNLHSDSINIAFRFLALSDMKEVRNDIWRCKTFCIAHINWASNPKWGTKCRSTKKSKT